jgi:hypothetical protein
MKKVFTVIALVAAVFTASAKEPVSRKLDANNIHTASKTFGVSMYQVKNSETVKVMIETGSKLTLKVSDASGKKLNVEAVKSSAAISLNFAEMPAGEYFVEVSNGSETITRLVTKSASESTLSL